MAQKSTEELLAEFRAVLDLTVEGFDNPITRFQFDNGTADWSLNDHEDGMIIDGISRHDVLKVLAHAVIIISHEEDRYYEDMQEEIEQALKEIEVDEEISDEEKALATELLEEGVRSQLEGFSHCVALIYGWANAAFAANESDTVNWDDMLKGATESD